MLLLYIQTIWPTMEEKGEGGSVRLAFWGTGPSDSIKRGGGGGGGETLGACLWMQESLVP